MDLVSNIDLVSVAFVVASTCVIGFSVYFSNPASATNQAFLGFALVTALWGVVNYLVYQTGDADIILWSLRFVLFFAVWQSFFLFELFYAFPHERPQYSTPHRYLLIPLVVVASLITLTPYTFSHIVQLSIGTVSDPDRGPGLIAFGFVAVSLVVAALYFLISKMRAAEPSHRGPFKLLLVGAAASFMLIITFNFLVPVLFHNLALIPFGAVFMFPLIACTAYAIQKHRIFNVKVAAAMLLVLSLAVMTFVEVIFSRELYVLVFRGSIFVLILLAGVLLIKNVIREVHQRELIERQEKELEEVNRQQENLLHFITHEVKGYLTKSEAAFAAIVAGDFGAVQPQLREMAHTALSDVRIGVDTVINILDAANLKRGTVALAKREFDLARTVEEVVNDLKQSADERGLELTFERPAGGVYTVVGDEEKLRRHVIRNIIDNSIRYTLKGFVRVELSRKDSIVRLTVSDSGVGITPEDMRRLFTEGGKGADSIKVNVHSTGYGLFIAKHIVEAHGGRIWAESAGKDRGSRFTVELPSN